MQISPDVVFRDFGEGAVLVNLSSNEIFELNETSAAVWLMVGRGETVDDMVASLVGQFDVDEPTARQACLQLLADLTARGLLLP